MKLGKAIKPIYCYNDGIPISPPLMINSKTIQFIDVMKCSECGYSDDELESPITAEEPK
jgi:hypothetical protein